MKKADGRLCSSRWVKFRGKPVSSARASGSTTLRFDLLDAETRSIRRFAEWNSEHRHRQPMGWSHLLNKCGARASSKSQRDTGFLL